MIFKAGSRSNNDLDSVSYSVTHLEEFVFQEKRLAVVVKGSRGPQVTTGDLKKVRGVCRFSFSVLTSVSC